MRPIIPIYPPAMFKDPKIIEATRGIRSPVTIEHSLTPCDRCGESGWIGPKQRQMAEAGVGDVLCIYCMVKDPEFQAAGVVPMVSLNPDIEQVPRRAQ